MSEKNLYQKMNDIKKGLLKTQIKKSGKANHSEYYELKDLLPHIIEKNEEHGIYELFSINKDEATLTLVNVDKPDEKVTASAPYVMASMNKSVDEVQKMGATITYYRRYLYLMVYGFSENDTIQKQQEQKSDPQVLAKKFTDLAKKEFGDKAQQILNEALSYIDELELDKVDFDEIIDIDGKKMTKKQAIFKVFKLQKEHQKGSENEKERF